MPPSGAANPLALSMPPTHRDSRRPTTTRPMACRTRMHGSAHPSYPWQDVHRRTRETPQCLSWLCTRKVHPSSSKTDTTGESTTRHRTSATNGHLDTPSTSQGTGAKLLREIGLVTNNNNRAPREADATTTQMRSVSRATRVPARPTQRQCCPGLSNRESDAKRIENLTTLHTI